MATDSKILREYLLSLGFRINEPQQKKFDTAVGKTDINVKGLAKSALAAAVATQAMVAVFARSMEKLYYSSIKAESAVGNIQALEHGAKQIGLAGGSMTTALEGMSRALRLNPGLSGLLESLGVPVQGRDRADVLKDMVKQLNKMPFYVASQYANLFGINPDDLLLLEKGMAEMEKFEQQRKDAAAAAGVDTEKAAAAGKEYMQTLRSLGMQLDLLKDSAALALLPTFKTLASVSSQVLTDWTAILRKWSDAPASAHGMLDPFYRVVEFLTGKAGGTRVADALTPQTRARLAGTSRSQSGTVGTESAGTASAALGKETTAQMFARLEKQYGLPEGFLDRMWKQESGRGKNMMGPMTRFGQAKGHFQFLDSTASEVGVKNPFDLPDAAQGAAKYMGMLMKMFGGDLVSATAAYNWGPGNVRNYGLGRAPKETQGYVSNVAGRPIEIHTNVTVHGAGDAKNTATLTANAVAAANSTIVRNNLVKLN